MDEEEETQSSPFIRVNCLPAADETSLHFQPDEASDGHLSGLITILMVVLLLVLELVLVLVLVLVMVLVLVLVLVLVFELGLGAELGNK